jgi:hypothetical protein
MNFVYGGLALVSSLLISDYFSKSKAESSRVFMQAFAVQFFIVILLAGIFYGLGWGFLTAISDLTEAIKRVGGFATFLGVLVGMRALNKRKRETLEQQADVNQD